MSLILRQFLQVTVLMAVTSACAPLRPISLPTETSGAPVETGIWQEIEDTYPKNWQVPLNDGPTALEWRLRSIDSATRSIEMQTFLWSFDAVGSEVLNHLKAAADRDVSVKLLVDDSFLAGQDRVLLALEDHPNIEYRIFNPYKRRSNGIASRAILNLGAFERLDHRMHNKAMIVDNQVAIIGGRNIADEYFGFDAAGNFRDMELLVGGPIVQEISSAFDEYWNDEWSFPIDRISHLEVSTHSSPHMTAASGQLNDFYATEDSATVRARWLNAVGQSFRGRVDLLVDEPPRQTTESFEVSPVQVADRLVDLISRARIEVVIVSAYLIPTPPLADAMRSAIERGVKVTILTNSIGSNNHLAAHSAYRNHIRGLVSSGVTLHEMRTEAEDRSLYIADPVQDKKLALHAKYLIIDDDEVFIGSANLDPRSLRINTEMGLLVRDRALNRAIREMTEPDLRSENAWRLELNAENQLIWIGDNVILNAEPASSFMQRIEDWFFAHLPIENEL